MAGEKDPGARSTIAEPRPRATLETRMSSKANELLAKLGQPTFSELLQAHGILSMPDNSVGLKVTDKRTGGEFGVRLFQKFPQGSRALFIEYPHMRQEADIAVPIQVLYVFDVEEGSWNMSVKEQQNLNKKNRMQANRYLKAIEETHVKAQRVHEIETMQLGYEARRQRDTAQA